jgi:aryl-alcohol dehydrogenase-like predicted oxidoreductase
VEFVLSGTATPDQLRSNLTALAVPWDDVAEETAGVLAEEPEDYWSTRARLSWN